MLSIAFKYIEIWSKRRNIAYIYKINNAPVTKFPVKIVVKNVHFSCSIYIKARNGRSEAACVQAYSIQCYLTYIKLN